MHDCGYEAVYSLTAFSNKQLLVHRYETVLPLSTSDHYGVIATINRNLANIELKVIKGHRIWKYSYTNWEGACELGH